MFRQEIRELELDFESQIKSLESILFENKSQVFFDLILIKYLEDNNTKKINITKWNGSKKLDDMIKMLKRENVFFKNVVKKENVYFGITQKTRFINFVWLDDIKLENATEQQLQYLTLVETSPKNYQAWIKLDKLYTESEIQRVKHYLIEKLKADKAASAKIQPMRIPGFYSFKHEMPFYVKIYRTAQKELPAGKILAKLETNGSSNYYNLANNFSKKEKSDKWKENSFFSKMKFDPLKEREYIKKNDINRFGAFDENIVDIKYIYQLLIRGYNKEQIAEFLMHARPDVDDKHLFGDYFERTYLKALLFKKVYYPNKKLYENRLLNDYIKLQKQKGNWDDNKKVVENLRILSKL